MKDFFQTFAPIALGLIFTSPTVSGSEPTYTPIMLATDPQSSLSSIYFLYQGGLETAIGGGVLQVVYPFPNNSVGGYALSCVYPSGPPVAPPYWFDGGTTSSHPLAGTEVYRYPSSGNRSNPVQASGLIFKGTFAGQTSFGTPPTNTVLEAVFFHTQPCYLGGTEYGFVRDVTRQTTSFYWSTNANCSQVSYCRSGPTADAPTMYEVSNSVTIDISKAAQPITYKAWIEALQGTYNFHVQVVDGFGQLVVDEDVNPGTWYPLVGLLNSTGYVTLGIQRRDISGTTTQVSPIEIRPWFVGVYNP